MAASCTSNNNIKSLSVVADYASNGVRDWKDKHGNYGFELQSLVESKVGLVKARRVFHYPCSSAQAPDKLCSYLVKPGRTARKVCVIVDERLAGPKIAEIEGYLDWCRSENIIQDFSITRVLVPTPAAKSLEHVFEIIKAAESLAMQRRDLLLAVGGSEILDVVGFAAGAYRRSTPWISVATDAEAAARWARRDFHVAIHSQSCADDLYPGSRGLLGFVQEPVAAFVDLDAVNGRPAEDQEHQAHDDEPQADVEQQHTVAKKVQYHVAAVPGLFDASSRALIEGYCQPLVAGGAKRKVLVVVEAFHGRQALEAAETYFRHHADAVAQVQVVSMHVSSAGKDMGAVQRVVAAAAQMGMAASDLFVVVGGGTLMDVVGLTAALYCGGTPYVRVPTTLVGMIDAGIGVKVGVNFGTRKNFLGRYYGPVACLNDAATFLPTLPPREYGCGLAEALKMACITSPRLFDLIEAHQTDLALNPYTHEVILLAVHTMLEQLAPNIHEHSLRRLVDFGHEFGHIIESLAHFTVPHGEAVSIGMAIASFLAYLTGDLPRQDLVRLLDCSLSLGLPIWSSRYDCCDPVELWEKISSFGIEHKDGMLYLVIPRVIGQGDFIDNLSAINADMLARAVNSLQTYSESHHFIPSEATTSSSPATPPSLQDDLAVSPSSSHGSLATTELETEDYSRLTAAVLGASGDIGSAFVQYLLDQGAKVICTVRPHPQRPHEYHRQRLQTPDHPNLRVIIGHPVDPAILTTVIRDADVIYNMAAMVSLSLSAADQARVIGLNGFGQGVISCMIKALGREGQVKVVYPSSQRVHLTLGHQDIDDWVCSAEKVFTEWSQQTLLPALKRDPTTASPGEQDSDMASALEGLATSFLAANPLPRSMINIYELSKRLGEQLVALTPRHVLIRISGVYGPTFARGFVSRAVKPKNKKSFEAVELRDFIYVDDVNKILLRSAFVQPPSGTAFDGASGEPTDLRMVWRKARQIIGDGAQVVFDEEGPEPVAIKLDTGFARELLERDFVPFEEGLYRTIDGRVRQVAAAELARFVLLERAEVFRQPKNMSASHDNNSLGSAITSRALSSSTWRLHQGAGGAGDDFFTISSADPMTCESQTMNPMVGNTISHAFSRWYRKLSQSSRVKVREYVARAGGILVHQRRLRQLAELSVEKNEQNEYRVSINIDHELADLLFLAGPKKKKGFEHLARDVVGRAGHHLLAFISRQCRPVLSRWVHQQEQDMARSWSAFLQPWLTPPVVVLDVGSTSLRTAVFGPHGKLTGEPSRVPSPSRHLYPQASLAELQKILIDTIVREIETLLVAHAELLPPLQHVAIGFGAVIDREGLVYDASIFWGESGKGFDLRAALQARLPAAAAMSLTIINDVSAAAWRFHDQERFCLITASSGLANKIFDRSMSGSLGLDSDRLALGRDGLGGEMGHVVVEPRLVDKVVAYARLEAARNLDEFKQSRLSALEATGEDPNRITAQSLGRAAVEGDVFARRLLDDKQVPCCPCGTLADLCSYGSGRAALDRARRLAPSYSINPAAVTDTWLQRAMAEDHPLARKVLAEATYPLALRILQMAADSGLEKFILVGGFALKTARGRYLPSVQDHLARLCTYTGFFGGWSEERVRGLVSLGADDDNDVLLGLGYYVHQVKSRYYHAAVKPIGENNSLTLETRELPSRIGDHQVLAKVIYAGVCSTDLQILRGERGLEPVVPGHEGVCQVVMAGAEVRGLTEGDLFVLLPNNPLDDSEKLGHNREGLFQEFVRFGQELIDRGQVLPLRQDDSGYGAGGGALSTSVVGPTMSLVEPLSCVVAATEDLITRRHIDGKNVLVVGAGTLGLLFVTAISSMMKARNVFLASRSTESVDFAVAKGIITREKAFAIGTDQVGHEDKDDADADADADVASSRGLESTAWAHKLASACEQGGIDTVIVCVSLGQGASVAQEALHIVNDGGFVHLFGGFCSGDVLALGRGNTVDVWPIRAEWKTESVKTGPEGRGKTVTLSGNRGSRKHHVAQAAQTLQQHGPAYARVITHLASLGAAPGVVRELAQNGRVGGVMAKRVVIDMSGVVGATAAAATAAAAEDHRRVQTVDEAAMEQLRHAARCGRRDLVPTGNRFRDLAWDGRMDELVLGWVGRPSWETVQASAEKMLLQVQTIGGGVEHVVWVGTGPWAFWIELLQRTMPATATRPTPKFHSLCSLDPHALATVLAAVGLDQEQGQGQGSSSSSLARVLCIGTSQSGTTIETTALMNVLRLHFDAAGLDYRVHFIWLTDRCASVRDTASGEATIRRMVSPDWADVDVIPLALVGQAPINALFATPYSSLVLLSLTLAFGPHDPILRLRRFYDEYVAHSDPTANSLLAQAAPLVTKNFSGGLRFILPDAMATNPGLERLVVQLFEQALGCKSANLCPRVRVVGVSSSAESSHGGLQHPAFSTVDLSNILPSEASPIVSALVLTNALNFLCAFIAYHTDSIFVTHPKVNLYKQRALDILTRPPPLEHNQQQQQQQQQPHEEGHPAQAVTVGQVNVPQNIADAALAYHATHPHVRFIDLLPYGHLALQLAREAEAGIVAKLGQAQSSSSAQGQTSQLGMMMTMVRTIPGESWNHSEFPAAVQINSRNDDTNHKDDTLRIFILPELLPTSATEKQSSSPPASSIESNPAFTSTKSNAEMNIIDRALSNNMRTLAAIGLATSQIMAEVATGQDGSNVMCFSC